MNWRSVIIALCFCTAVGVHADAPIDVERKAASGDYLAALASYDRMPRRTDTAQSVLAAARSAWALGLTERALALIDTALRRGDLAPTDQTRALFSKATIYYQSDRHQLALLTVEQALGQLPGASPLRGALLLLKAQVLSDLGQFPGSVTALQQAQGEVEESLRGELDFQLGRALARVGRFAEAKESLRRIATSHERAADGIKQLIEIADQERDFIRAAHWVEQGRELFPDAFLDGRFDYIAASGIQARVATGEITPQQSLQDYEELRKRVSARLAPSDPWLALIIAVGEQQRRSTSEAVRASIMSRAQGLSGNSPDNHSLQLEVEQGSDSVPDTIGGAALGAAPQGSEVSTAVFLPPDNVSSHAQPVISSPAGTGVAQTPNISGNTSGAASLSEDRMVIPRVSNAVGTNAPPPPAIQIREVRRE